MKLDCAYQTPRPTKKDQSMAVAINAIRRLEAKVEDLTTAINTQKSSQMAPPPSIDHRSPASVMSQPSPGITTSGTTLSAPRRASEYDNGTSPRTTEGTPGDYPTLGTGNGRVQLSFSQHGVAMWPAIRQLLPPAFSAARDALSKDYVVDIESQRPPLPMIIDVPMDAFSEQWLTRLPISVIRGLANAYFAVFHRSNPVLDKFYFFSHTLTQAMENDFGYDIETSLVLVVLALGCLAVRAHEEGNFPLPSRYAMVGEGFVRPDWYEYVLDEPPGLKFFNEARKRFGFLMCQSDLQTGQFYMLSTLYYAQILRPFDSWVTVNRAALCCVTILKRVDSINFDEWEGDMFVRLFWNTLMYEVIITQELLLPLSRLLEWETDMPIPKFTPSPRPKTSISGLVIDEDDSFFNFHFLAQAAHRIILTRLRYNMYQFSDKEGAPTASMTAEMRHQLEQWRTNLPPSLQFTDDENLELSPSPAHVFAKAMLRSRYLVAKFHLGRPFLYKALHYSPGQISDNEYREIADGLKGGMYWPTTMGLCTQMKAALPLKFGWCSQCFGQVLIIHAVARSPDARLRESLPAGWEDWVKIMVQLIEDCGKYSPGLAQDAALLRLI
ncbi:hypothetical protein BU24DRAFT_430726 [Aaosphaeria arxii CBS 175.79]|uniref:Xylanolytic transcriptional activator regulatory domain-containing protein n=1 Tax=Aaosphaeria arxii CBS 175.79 TaxID=1450172 RepID=A0A6A5YAY8_9PLEO|nr:uncharacterized protein BU24DRAFT_430726 [Aaosphaeria arxii CBS 175.79]KAF2022393.1 hypothetical protein BU24DRAFT_430726 [Aaosphaeria arxii CBS 175.79]